MYRPDRLDEVGFPGVAAGLRQRMRALLATPPIPYRRQNGGDYLIPGMQLRPDVGGSGLVGFAAHVES